MGDRETTVKEAIRVPEAWRRRVERRLRNVEAGLPRRTSEEENVVRDTQDQGTNVGSFTFGTAVNRPTTDYLLARGTRSMLYFATDTFVLSAWTGLAWKTVTLS